MCALDAAARTGAWRPAISRIGARCRFATVRSSPRSGSHDRSRCESPPAWTAHAAGRMRPHGRVGRELRPLRVRSSELPPWRRARKPAGRGRRPGRAPCAAICIGFPRGDRAAQPRSADVVHTEQELLRHDVGKGHHGNGFPHLWCAAPPGVQQEMVEAEPDRYFRPPYVGGRAGWASASMSTSTGTRSPGICEDAYRTIAPNGSWHVSTTRTGRSRPTPGVTSLRPRKIRT